MSKGVFGNIGGVWKQFKGAFVNVGGVWKNVPSLWNNIGGVWKQIPFSSKIVATGGTVTDVTIGGVNYRVHTFLSNGTFTVTAGQGTVEFFLLSGGKTSTENGGNGGGFRITSVNVTGAKTFTCTVGQENGFSTVVASDVSLTSSGTTGGTGSAYGRPPANGGAGPTSDFDGTTRAYGGGGAGYNTAPSGTQYFGIRYPGGSGGGGSGGANVDSPAGGQGENGLGGGGGGGSPSYGHGGSGRIMVRYQR